MVRRLQLHSTIQRQEGYNFTPRYNTKKATTPLDEKTPSGKQRTLYKPDDK
jgi:hypothetical protein